MCTQESGVNPGQGPGTGGRWVPRLGSSVGCNYSCNVITCNYSPCFSITCNLTSIEASEWDDEELDEFEQGAREALAQLGTLVYNRALLDTKLATSTAEYILRRTLLDTGDRLGGLGG